jgi:hypothetical protein
MNGYNNRTSGWIFRGRAGPKWPVELFSVPYFRRNALSCSFIVMSKALVTVLFICFSMFFLACSPTYSRYLPAYRADNSAHMPDYSSLRDWAAHPFKYDPSDSVPRPLRRKYQPDSTIDVFFLHPTTLTSVEDTAWNATVADPELNLKTDYTSILYQASIFNEYRVFAPRYRQAHIRSYFTTDTATALQAFEIAYQDVRAAFMYYLEHYNGGRPVIIASHSQGTTHALRLVKEFFDSTGKQRQLVAAYLTGMYIPGNYFQTLQICKTPEQINCYCGWRTYQVDYTPDFVLKEKIQSSVTNPLTWGTSNDFAERKLNEGSILRKFNRMYHNVSDARISGGILWTTKPKFPGSFMLRTKNYHVGDLNLYYLNIRNNLRQRVAAFKKQTGAG